MEYFFYKVDLKNISDKEIELEVFKNNYYYSEKYTLTNFESKEIDSIKNIILFRDNKKVIILSPLDENYESLKKYFTNYEYIIFYLLERKKIENINLSIPNNNFLNFLKYFPETKNNVVEEKNNRNVKNLEEILEHSNTKLERGIFFIIKTAIDFFSSDIHFEKVNGKIRVRYRINGLLKEITTLDEIYLNPLLSKIKILSSLDIVEKRKPQDGRFSLIYQGREIDFRVSIMPTIDYEKIVIRILDKLNYSFSIKDLYLNKNEKIFFKGINHNNGIILINGPTGSGKSTTLYSILKYKNSENFNISTVEDPVEYKIEGINQIQCKNEIGLNFATILRSLLRQDPDILMIGEIRDKETAEIAVKASLTGHLVFSTLHSSNSLNSITRLLNLGIDPYILSTVIVMIVSQRLLRKLCPHCKKIDEEAVKKLESLNVTSAEIKNKIFYTHFGCEKCLNTGYVSRIPIFEIIYFDNELKNMLLNKESDEKILETALKNGTRLLLDDALEKAIDGLTSLDEILRQL